MMLSCRQTEMHASHTAAVEQMSHRAFEQLPAFSQKGFPLVAANSPTVAVDRVALGFFAFPATAATLGLRDISTNG